ncbi:MAG: DUF1848 domain-containing protein [Planctomycetes bacterium]|nr:DUF1848 domain-containing protein [Planctomycetota bacterium]
MTPSLKGAIDTCRELAQRVGPVRVIWRYDPIGFTGLTPASYHLENYQRIAQSLRGITCRSVISSQRGDRLDVGRVFQPLPRPKTVGPVCRRSHGQSQRLTVAGADRCGGGNEVGRQAILYHGYRNPATPERGNRRNDALPFGACRVGHPAGSVPRKTVLRFINFG